MMTEQQLKELNYLLSLATEETSSKVLRRMLDILKEGLPNENSGLEELGYVAASKLMERGEL
jgi:hypothetical protein